MSLELLPLFGFGVNQHNASLIRANLMIPKPLRSIHNRVFNFITRVTGEIVPKLFTYLLRVGYFDHRTN